MPRHVRVPYTCPRCAYVTAIKQHMRQHLYNTRKECPASNAKILLTDEIKSHILENRVYNIPADISPRYQKIKGSYAGKAENTSGFIYVIHEREFMRMNESVFKVGQTINHSKRISKYPKGSELLFMCKVPDCIYVEKNILQVLGTMFKQRRDIGAEYFEANESELIDVVAQEIISLRPPSPSPETTVIQHVSSIADENDDDNIL
jgi:hypothetical protein